MVGSAALANNLAARLDGVRDDALYARVLFLFLGAPGVVLAALILSPWSVRSSKRAASASSCCAASKRSPLISDDRPLMGATERRVDAGGARAGARSGSRGRLATYAAAKAYVLSLTESLSQELSGTGVTATALCPGLTDTAMVRGSQMTKVVPAPMIMSPKDVAELGCSACLKGETIWVPGLANRALTSGAQLLPRALVRSIGGMATVRGSGRIGGAFFGGGAAG